MSSDTRALADAARGLLLSGDAGGAERVLAPVFRDLKSDSAVLHLMGMIKKAQGDLAEAERFLRAAIASDLKEGGYYSDLGVVLQARGAFEEAERVFRAAIVLMEDPGNTRINLVRCLVAAGQIAEAEAEARGFIAANPSAESWTVLGQVQSAQQHYEAAAVSARKAFELAPNKRPVRHNLAIALDRAGDAKGALEQLQSLAEDGIENPELAVNLARALHLEGEPEAAEAVLIDAVRAWPTSTPAHSALAKLRWLNGESEEATSYLEAALKENPKDMGLLLACADILNRAEFHDKARMLLAEGLKTAPDHPALLSSMGVVLDECGRVGEALDFLKRAARLTPGVIHTHRNLIPTLLRGEEVEEALRITRAIRKVTPEDQELIAYEATALRMLGDPAYHVLYDFDRLVKAYNIHAPRGYFSVENFNASLAESLGALHKASAHPLDQTLRYGSQTGRSLLSSSDVNIKALLEALAAPIDAYISDLLAHPQDPVGRRKTEAWRMHSCWSVRLDPGGFHVNHVHQAGWISSAYYVALPELKNEPDERAGWLKFGEPRYETKGCPPEKFAQPRVGTLVLFPSFLWHGTVPFQSGGARLTCAFDVVPA
jgi:Flp pilus assembly protein TadD